MFSRLPLGTAPAAVYIYNTTFSLDFHYNTRHESTRMHVMWSPVPNICRIAGAFTDPPHRLTHVQPSFYTTRQAANTQMRNSRSSLVRILSTYVQYTMQTEATSARDVMQSAATPGTEATKGGCP